MNPKKVAESILAKGDIRINGSRPWDMRVHDDRVFAMAIARGSLGLGEAYQAGYWDCDDLEGFFARAMTNEIAQGLPLSAELALYALRAKVQNRQAPELVRQAADVHYDMPPEFFQLMYADSRITGSCGVWKTATTLEEAQEYKLDLVCRKLGLQKGQTVGDIGCGWGAFMSLAAERYGVRATGVTISKEQVAYIRKRYRHLDVHAKVMDYREWDEPVDHLASMGMFEHVGHKNYRAYFERAHRNLRPDGLFVLHTCWADRREDRIDPWLDKYIFPNGVIPTVGQITTACEGLFRVLDVQNFGPDYAKTLRAWAQALEDNKEKLPAIFGKDAELVYRTQRYYLLQCAAGFDIGALSVGQFVLAPSGCVRGRTTYQAVR